MGEFFIGLLEPAVRPLLRFIESREDILKSLSGQPLTTKGKTSGGELIEVNSNGSRSASSFSRVQPNIMLISTGKLPCDTALDPILSSDHNTRARIERLQ
jgi:hypothetical protein